MWRWVWWVGVVVGRYGGGCGGWVWRWVWWVGVEVGVVSGCGGGCGDGCGGWVGVDYIMYYILR